MRELARVKGWLRTSVAVIGLLWSGLGAASESPPDIVIPALGSDESVPVTSPLQADEQNDETASPVPALRLRGYWMGFEIIIFERPDTGYVVQGETLRTGVPHALPARLASLDPVGMGGSVMPGSGQAAPTEDPLRALFASPPRQEALDLVYPPEPAPVPATEPTAAPAAAPSVEPAAETSAQPTPGPIAADPLPQPPDPREVLEDMLAAYEADLAERSLTWLDPAARRLDGAAARIAAAGGYRVLLHEAWIQNLAERGAPAVLFMPNSDGALIGSAQVIRQRGARLRLNLAFRGADAPADDPGYLLLADERRVGRGTYYIDHPRLGVILRTTEVGIPPALQEAFAALTNPPPAPAAAAPAPTPSPTP